MNITSKLLISKIKKIFPHKKSGEIISILNLYGTEKYEREKDRVYLAILKLCEEEMLDDPSKYVEMAKKDYRDIIAMAEYPNQYRHKNTALADAEELNRLKQLDSEQYQRWIHTD